MKHLIWCLPLALVASCTNDDPYDVDNPARTTGGTTTEKTTTGAPSNDLTVTQAVRKAIGEDADLTVDASTIEVATMNGRVTLRGTVSSQEEKDRVVSKVRTLPGVTSVDDQLEVK